MAIQRLVYTGSEQLYLEGLKLETTQMSTNRQKIEHTVLQRFNGLLLNNKNNAHCDDRIMALSE